LNREDIKKPLILITNDDGIEAPGFVAAVRAARGFGDILVAAPAGQQTAMGRSYPRYPDLGVVETRQLDLGDETVTAYAVHSSPAHAVCYGVMELAPRKPDLVVSGINHGANLGMSITCSGTIGACLEAMSEGIPSVALSLETGSAKILEATNDVDFSCAEAAGAYWIEKVLREGMPRDCEILNINVPGCRVTPEAYRLTRLDRQNYYQMKQPAARDFAKPFTIDFRIGIDRETLFEDGDIRCVCVDRLTSVTPLGWDMTK
jgi:5'-nucleotidase